MLFPDRPELMESTVGESLPAILEEDRLSVEPYGLSLPLSSFEISFPAA